ncbi:3-hydroxy-3-methylglutaryl-CoA lyase [Platysternon megacephalum]|uniref:3-hydroxy-3-methylglutaryl-CoA lyase n=1 Tax=Platysternon megacephalum TaxID=55544 RepID=A0A4D9DEF8_9SAUR|nr:3-hydroxy-3-methylglutaryl-CoA lyase [Platysternon megacephalum]
MNPSAVVEATGLVKTYGAGAQVVRAVDNVSVAFAPGTFTAIMGPSGSGKSTLMHCLAGLDEITSGSVRLDSVELAGMSDRYLTQLRREKVGFVFQQFNLLPGLTMLENIRLPLRLAGMKPDIGYEQRLIDSLGLANRLDHRPSELSGGQQQRAAIARALITHPAVVFADEPTGALDSKNGVAILEYLRRASTEDNQSIVMVTHDANAASYASRVLLMSDGRIVDDLSAPPAGALLAAIARIDARSAR